MEMNGLCLTFEAGGPHAHVYAFYEYLSGNINKAALPPPSALGVGRYKPCLIHIVRNNSIKHR